MSYVKVRVETARKYASITKDVIEEDRAKDAKEIVDDRLASNNRFIAKIRLLPAFVISAFGLRTEDYTFEEAEQQVKSEDAHYFLSDYWRATTKYYSQYEKCKGVLRLCNSCDPLCNYVLMDVEHLEAIHLGGVD